MPDTKPAGEKPAPPDPAPPAKPDPDAAEAEKANKLSPEEQMAQFEQHLIENDTGHRPC